MVKKTKVLSVVLALLVGIVFSYVNVVAASTTIDLENTNCKSIKANTEQLRILNELNGSDVSVGEVLREVFPSAITSIPVDILKQLDATKMNWPNAETLKGSATQNATRSLTHQSVASSNGTRVDYYSRSLSSVTMPYMFVVSYLYEYQTNNYVDAIYNSNTNTKSVTATTSYYPSPGLYQAIGLHNGTYPQGYTPASYSGVESYSDAVGVLP